MAEPEKLYEPTRPAAQRLLSPVNKDDINPEADKYYPEIDKGFEFNRGTDRLIQNKKPFGFMNYEDTVGHLYKNYPGGYQKARKEASDYRKKINNNFDSKASVALGGRIDDDWVMNRKNPVFVEKRPNRSDGPGRVIGGTSYTDKVKNAGKTFSATQLFPGSIARNLHKTLPRGYDNPRLHPQLEELLQDQLNRGVRPSHSIVEEAYHNTQPRFTKGEFTHQFKDPEGHFGPRGGDLPYAATNHELAAKLTGHKQEYISNNWGDENAIGMPGRKDSFNETDAAKIMDRLIEGKHSSDYGLKTMLMQDKGPEYLKKNRGELIQFMMSTASNDRQKTKAPGLFTGKPQIA